MWHLAQVKNLEHQLGDTEKRLQEMVTASQRQTNIAQHEVRFHSTLSDCLDLMVVKAAQHPGEHWH